MKKNKIVLTEGYKNIIIVFIVSLLTIWFISDFIGYVGILISIFMVYVYRDNYRHIFKNTQSVLAPIDGTVLSIDKVNGKFKIYYKVSLCNNHVLRAPIDGELKVKKYHRGLNLNPNTYKASLYNEQVVLKFDDIKIKLISGVCNNKIKRIQEATVSQGDKISVFLDGLVIITVDQKYDLLIKIGDKLTSGQSVLFKK